MSGCLNGASSLIRAEHDKAIYVHCMNHRLNLCVADTCELPLVRNMMDVVRNLSEVLDNSSKRQQHWISKIRVSMPAANHFVLPSMTRIIQRQVHRNNAPATTPEDYYRINLTTDFLNHALMQLDSRFEDDVFVCYKEFSKAITVPLNSGALIPKLLDDSRQQMLAILEVAISDSSIHSDIQLVLEQHLKEHHEDKRSVTSILRHPDALEHKLNS
ncbi:unnamed protein product [Porites evermanni]|uniref:Zinc finger MYM-type protein 1 n=1 Tax=Porites evermanni TaxID=104178 RepID=A0ABN8MNM5_9CNID|nr:unnamed protein product [Porites evermanni]